jgi:branched-subunit amino acid transport protein
MSDTEVVLTIVGLTALSLLTRGFFLLPRRDLPMPGWLREGLRYAPLAALMAVLAPDILMTQGELIHTWRDPRLFGAVAAAAWYYLRRDMLGTIVAGTAVMLALRLGLGW